MWLHRALILLFVFFCATVGVLLVILPWRPEWTDNYFLLGSPDSGLSFPTVLCAACAAAGAARYLDRIWEAVHFHDENGTDEKTPSS